MAVYQIPSSIKDELISYQDLKVLQEPKSSFEQQRKISFGDQESRIKQLNNQIEELSLSNARLVRSNRMLKLESDKIVNEKTKDLKQALKHSIEQNIRLQRANRLLKDDIQNKIEELNNVKQEQIRKMNHVGPEYEYLVQVVHLLYRQLSDKATCESTCCFTEKPVIEGTLSSPILEKETNTPKHICRPAIHSHQSAGSLATQFEKENQQLKETLNILMNDRDTLYHLLKDKEEDCDILKKEIQVKDGIVKQLENDFEKMESEVLDLQKEWYLNRSPDSTFSEIHSFPTVPT